MCKYKVVFPEGADEFDEIRVNVTGQKNVRMMVVDTSSFGSEDFQESVMAPQSHIIIKYPNMLYIVLESTEKTQPADFEFSYRFQAKDQPDLSAVNLQASIADRLVSAALITTFATALSLF